MDHSEKGIPSEKDISHEIDATTAYKVTDLQNRSFIVSMRGWRRVYKQWKWVTMRRPAFVFSSLEEATGFAQMASSEHRIWRCSVVGAREIQMIAIVYTHKPDSIPILRKTKNRLLSKRFKWFWKGGTINRPPTVRSPVGTLICDKVMLTHMEAERK